MIGNSCMRPGCSRYARPAAHGRRRGYCNFPGCYRWHISFVAFTEGGASLGRDAAVDTALFADTLAKMNGQVISEDPEAWASLRDLWDAYGRA